MWTTEALKGHFRFQRTEQVKLLRKNPLANVSFYLIRYSGTKCHNANYQFNVARVEPCIKVKSFLSPGLRERKLYI